jgi:mannose-6-phosphate isomerase
VLVPGGQPHAIGEGVLVLELQEPTDLSVMLEHERFGLEEAHAFLGLDRAVALRSVDHGPLTAHDLAGLRRRWTDVRGAGPALPTESHEYFRAQVVRPTDPSPAASVTVPADFAVTVVVEGRGTLATEYGAASGAPIDIARGDVLLVPHGAGAVRVAGDVTVIRCMPPADTAVT